MVESTHLHQNVWLVWFKLNVEVIYKDIFIRPVYLHKAKVRCLVWFIYFKRLRWLVNVAALADVCSVLLLPALFPTLLLNSVV